LPKERIPRGALCCLWFELGEEKSPRYEIESHRKLANGGHRVEVPFEEDLEKVAAVTRSPEPNASACLRVEVDKKDAPSHIDERPGEAHGGGGLPYPAFGIHNGDALHNEPSWFWKQCLHRFQAPSCPGRARVERCRFYMRQGSQTLAKPSTEIFPALAALPANAAMPVKDQGGESSRAARGAIAFFGSDGRNACDASNASVSGINSLAAR
jgi:hypothetical protein